MVAGNFPSRPQTFGQRVPLGERIAFPAGHRLLLWLDAVGGFLVCAAERVMLGQALPAAGVDVPLQADISRRHLTIRRDPEGYVAVPLAATQIDGRVVPGAANLRDGALLQLNAHVRIHFRQPHPLSSTARLDLVSHHRTQPAVDGVILMADTLVLGPHPTCHIVAPHLNREVVLFRDDDQWTCHTAGKVEIDSHGCPTGRGIVPRITLRGRDFSLAVESV